MANVKEIEWKGGIYNIADEVARGEAQQARALANTAQDTANNAQTSANNAQTTADNAQTSANNAQITANTAKGTADNISTQFSDYKELESASVEFEQTGVVVFKKRGNICQISISGRRIADGKYTIPIPAGFAPLPESFEPGFLLIRGNSIVGYWSVSENFVTIYVDVLTNINAQQTFLM